jgi:hypothetical protein
MYMTNELPSITCVLLTTGAQREYLALAVLGYVREVGCDELSVLVADVARRGFAIQWNRHAFMLPTLRHRVHNRL